MLNEAPRRISNLDRRRLSCPIALSLGGAAPLRSAGEGGRVEGRPRWLAVRLACVKGDSSRGQPPACAGKLSQKQVGKRFSPSQQAGGCNDPVLEALENLTEAPGAAPQTPRNEQEEPLSNPAPGKCPAAVWSPFPRIGSIAAGKVASLRCPPAFCCRCPGNPRMYTITKGPSKLATQRRTGPTQQVESKLADLKCRRQQQQQQLSSWPLSSPLPKLVFNRVNGKRPPLILSPMTATEENYTVAHEENVRFVYEAWQQVEQQLNSRQQGDSRSGPVQYAEKTPNPELKDFVPIDLEEWWAQQFLAKIKNGS